MTNQPDPDHPPAALSLAEWTEPALQPVHQQPRRSAQPHLPHLVLPPQALRIETCEGPLRGSVIWVPVPSSPRPSMLGLLAARAAVAARRAALRS